MTARPWPDEQALSPPVRRALPDYLGALDLRGLGLDPPTLPTYWLGLGGQPCWPRDEQLSYLGLAEGDQ
jgi:hypothetical protein